MGSEMCIRDRIKTVTHCVRSDAQKARARLFGVISMVRHILLSSVIAASAGSIFFVLICIPRYGIAAVTFPLFSFPVAFILCLLFAYPLIKLKPKLSEANYFLMFFGLGFSFGVIIPAIITGDLASVFSMEIVFYYGLLGIATAVSAWYYVSRNVHL